MMPKSKTLKQQARDAELGLIIDEFGRAMWNANREYIGSTSACQHQRPVFTLSMSVAWDKYIDFCTRHPK